MEFQRGITDRQRVRLILADLLQASRLYERVEQEHSKSGQSVTAKKKEMTRAALIKLQAEAKRVVETVGYPRDRERLAALLNVPLTWLMTVAWLI